MNRTRQFVERIPLAPALYGLYSRLRFPGSGDYWKRRYRGGGNSGAGSYDHLAHFKAEVINDYVRKHDIQSVIEFGCGDGNQLSLLQVPCYAGLDISPTVIEAALLWSNPLRTRYSP
jgi:hypothetical protein